MILVEKKDWGYTFFFSVMRTKHIKKKGFRGPKG